MRAEGDWRRADVADRPRGVSADDIGRPRDARAERDFQRDRTTEHRSRAVLVARILLGQ